MTNLFLGMLIGWIAGILFTIWCDRKPWNACHKGGFHHWDDYMQPDDFTKTNSRFCSKCGVDEESNWWGQSLR